MEKDVIIRKAVDRDIPFIVETIIEGEKSGTRRIGLANHFGLSEEDLRVFLKQAIEEEIDGSEWSLASYVIAECDGKPVSALAGWLEGENEDGLPSSIIKSNLLAYLLPTDVIKASSQNISIVKGIQVEREKGSYELEYSYTLPEYRGLHLNTRIISEHIKIAKESGASKMRMHTFCNNDANIKMYLRVGFEIVKTQSSDHSKTKELYPYDKLYIMEKQI